jgi:hypothetical protein
VSRLLLVHVQMLTSRAALLDFQIPRGLRLQISSLAAPNFATSYTLGSVGVVDGSVSYLYSSLPLRKDFKSSRIDLHHVIRGYKRLQELRRPDESWWWETWHAGRRIDRRSEDGGTTSVSSAKTRQILCSTGASSCPSPDSRPCICDASPQRDNSASPP